MKRELGIRISGKVVHGDHFGKKLGFPTANLDRRDYARRKLNIRLGIYAGRAIVAAACLAEARAKRAIGRQKNGSRWLPLQGQMLYPAAIVIGPLDKHRLPKIEAHLLNFNGNLYGKRIILSLGKYIRPFKKFLSGDVLKKQIAKDVVRIKKLKYE